MLSVISSVKKGLNIYPAGGGIVLLDLQNANNDQADKLVGR